MAEIPSAAGFVRLLVKEAVYYDGTDIAKAAAMVQEDRRAIVEACCRAVCWPKDHATRRNHTAACDAIREALAPMLKEE